MRHDVTRRSAELPLRLGLDVIGGLRFRPAMQCKLDKLRDAAAAGDWPCALRIAAKFPRLGEHAAVIARAHEAAWHPQWARQLGRDPAADVAAGIEALKARYGIGE